MSETNPHLEVRESSKKMCVEIRDNWMCKIERTQEGRACCATVCEVSF